MESGKNENLVVVSKLKKYIKETFGLSTSATVPERLTILIREICEYGAENAKKAGRKTVMDRDLPSSLGLSQGGEPSQPKQAIG